jgi:beta-glucanase (GH16 family)
MPALSLIGYHLTFDAEMNRPADMSPFANSFENGNTTLWNNKEAENYVPYKASPVNPYQFTNGALVISAAPIPNGGLPYTSGMLATFASFAQSSGYFEIRAETPAAPGFWPAFWMLPVGEGYPEIDIMEQPNNSGTDTEYWTHTSTATNSSGGFTDTGVNLTQGYHTYGFMWTPTTIQYVFDGNYIGSPQQTPPSLAGLPMYLLANLAVGGAGSWPGAPPQAASSTYSIDYIRAFSNDPTVPAVQQQPISAPDGADTIPVLTYPNPVVPPPIGSGHDTLILNMSEDPYNGDAQFTVTVDGVQYGGTLTTTAINAGGQTQPFAIKGDFSPGAHVVTVDFLNDVNDGPGEDRNLYVDSATINHVAILDAALAEYSSGPQSFNFRRVPPPPLRIGSGPDLFVFGIGEDKTTRNAKFTISVDGIPQGGTLTAGGQRVDGQNQLVTVAGTFGAGPHSEVVTLLNGAASGKATGPNLYVNSLTYDGAPTPHGSGTLTQNGSLTFATPSTTDTLTIGLSEDAWKGDAQAQISLDGTVMGTVAVTASNAESAVQTLTYTGNFGGIAEQHVVTVTFLNDLFVAPSKDRNLYVRNMAFDGASTLANPIGLMRDGPVTFTIPPSASAGQAKFPSRRRARVLPVFAAYCKFRMCR